MKKTLLFLVMLASSLSFLMGQTTIAIQDFDGGTPTWGYNNGGSSATGNGSFPSTPKYVSASTGRQVSNGSDEIILDAIDASAYTNISFSMRLASFSGSSGNGADGGDDVTISVSTDGGSSYSDELEIRGNSNARWGFSGTQAGTGTANVTYDGNNSPTSHSPSSGGYRTSDGYTFLTISNLPNSSDLRIKITLTNNSGNELWVIDDAELTGDLAVVAPEPTNHATSLISATGTPAQSVIDLAWDDATMGAQLPTGYLIQANTTGTFTDPVDGTDPTEDTDLSDNSAIVKVAQGTETYTFSSLMPNTQYYFKMWSYTNTGANIDFKTDGTPPEDNTTTAVDPCATPAAFPYTQDFSSGSLPTCWSNEDNDGGGQIWQFNNPGSVTFNSTSNGNGFAILDSDNYGSGDSQDADLISPLFDFSGQSNISLEFEHYYRHTSGSSATLSYSIDGGTTWTTINSWTSSTSNAATFSQVIPAVAGQSAVKFKWNYQGSFAWYWAIDDIEIKTAVPTVEFTSASSSVAEGDSGTSNHTVDITMDIAPSSDADVDVVNLDDSATTADNDYSFSSPTLTFPAAGVYPMTQSVTVTINGDTDIETDETFDLALAMATGHEALADEGTDTHTVTITNDDAAPVCLTEAFDNLDLWENDGTSTDNVGSHAGNSIPCRALGNNDNLISPSFDNPQSLSFYQDASGGGNGNTATVDYQIGNGSWTSLYSFNVSTSGGTEMVDLTNIGGVDLSAETSVRFRFNSSFNTWYLDDVVVSGPSCMLPISLLSFTATPQNKTTLIKWTTSQELNNDYMAVERSSDGRNFTEIGRMQGAGNSDEAQQYSLIDKQPMAGVNYYRLRQVDFDGTTHFHKIVSVHFDAVDSDIRIAPTAVANHVMVYLPAVLNNDATINVYDANGRLWQSSQMTAGNAQAQFDFSQLAAGNYFLQIIDGQNLSTLRFTKL